MNHQTDTPASFSNVPGHTRLFRREPGGTYYLRAKVPPPLRPIVGKTEIRVSLKTKTLKEGVARVKLESLKVDRLFADAEAKFKGEEPRPARFSREELAWIVSDWFVKKEANSKDWISNVFPRLSYDLQEQALDGMRANEAALSDSSPYGEPCDGRPYLKQFLKSEGIDLGIVEGSEDYNRLLPLFREALEESLERSNDRVSGERLRLSNAAFKGLHATTLLPPRPSSVAQKSVALGKFLDGFMDHQKKVRSETTVAAYAMPLRVLQEIIGENTPVNTITRSHLEEVCKILEQIPVNMAQRYPNLSIRKAIEAAERANDLRRLKPRTASNYYTLIVAIFNYAIDEQLLTENPSKSRKLREAFKQTKTPQKRRARFTAEELKAIFSAPLFTGCMDDGRGYATPGENKPRQGRFWAPLIALFTGLRCNEVCQLYTEDIREENGIPYFNVRADSEDEEETEKRVKNFTSWRKAPIHSELLKMGFLDYVASRRLDTSSTRLFPTLPIAKRVRRYSSVFSKWFGRFLIRACGYRPKATFHSFRHHFATELTNIGVPSPLIESLAGWKSQGSSIIEYRHSDLPVLRDALEKLRHPGLDLSHLYQR